MRDKVSVFLLLWETGQLRNCSKFHCRAEITLNLGRIPRVVKYTIALFLPDWEDETSVTECESLAVVSKSCWRTYQSLTRNYLKFA